MKIQNHYLLLFFLALAFSAGHLVRAGDVKFLFSDKHEDEYVMVSSVKARDAKLPMRFKLSRCVERVSHESGATEATCTPLGRKEGYTTEEIRMKAYQLADQRVQHGQSVAQARIIDTLYDLLDGIERPRIRFETRSYSYNVKGNVDQFAKAVEVLK